jgi:hypothetical protein
VTHECGAVEAAVEVEVATIVVEAVIALVKVVVEAERLSGARRQSAQEAHTARAPLGPEPEEPVLVPAPNDIGTPPPARRRVRGAPGPHVAQQRVSGPRMAQVGAPGLCVAQQEVSGPRVAQETPGPHGV